jgi:hypothetical protein
MQAKPTSNIFKMFCYKVVVTGTEGGLSVPVGMGGSGAYIFEKSISLLNILAPEVCHEASYVLRLHKRYAPSYNLAPRICAPLERGTVDVAMYKNNTKWNEIENKHGIKSFLYIYFIDYIPLSCINP